MKLNIVLLSLVCLASLPAFAAEDEGEGHVVTNESSASSGNGLLKKFEENHAITDAELKSREGSLTQFSLKARVSYSGPTLDNLSAADQPIPDGGVSASAVGPKGDFGARFRFSPTDSITANAGLTDQYLFTNKPSHLDVNNPFLTYDKSFKLGGVQMVASQGVTMVTSNVYRPKGEFGSVDARLYSMYNLGNSPFTLGTNFTASYYFFDRDYIPNHQVGKTTVGDGKITRINVVFAPVIKYNLSDKFNVNTSWGFNFINPRMYDNAFKYQARLMNQWIGVGYAVTRDIYINPYIQFYPTEFTWSTATFNMSASVSLL